MFGVPGGPTSPASDDRDRVLMDGYSCIRLWTISGGIIILMSVDAELNIEGSGGRRWCESQLMSYSPIIRSRAGLGGEVSIEVTEVRLDCCR